MSGGSEREADREAVAAEGEGEREGDGDGPWIGLWAAGAQPNTDMCFTSLSLRLYTEKNSRNRELEFRGETRMSFLTVELPTITTSSLVATAHEILHSGL